MSRQKWKRERTKQTFRLYNLLNIPILDTEKIDKDNIILEIYDCINKGADLCRRIYGKTLIIWQAIIVGHNSEILKILIDTGGLFEDLCIINCQTYTRNSDRELYYTKSLEWVISETFEGLEEYKQRILNRVNEEGEQEDDIKCIKELELTMKRYEEYKTIFNIEKFDLGYCRKNGYYS
jgi:hypothetical protein